MNYKLPSLNALRAFEAAARHGSVKDAARELFVTPGAVSQQIKTLEQELERPLLRRVHRGIELTAAGEALYPVLRQSFQGISDTLEGIRERERRGTLTVSTLPSFAAKWLVPRLGRFQQRHPEIDVLIEASAQLTDFDREDVDVVVRYTVDPGTQLHSEWLLAEDLNPVCSPTLMNGLHPLLKPEDLRHHALLHDETHREWQMWLEANGVEGIESRRGPVFTDASMALQAAIQGQGVAMGRGELMADELADGRLVKPFDLAMPPRFAYYVLCLRAAANWPKVAAFREWIQDEARRERAPRSTPGR